MVVNIVIRFPIAFDPLRTILAVPVVDSISWENFHYRPVYHNGRLYRGIFEWGFLYKENEVPQHERNRHKHRAEPYWWVKSISARSSSTGEKPLVSVCTRALHSTLIIIPTASVSPYFWCDSSSTCCKSNCFCPWEAVRHYSGSFQVDLCTLCLFVYHIPQKSFCTPD